MNNIDWNLTRAFCATADAGSLSAAARKLGSSQPTLSRQVAALEEALGVTLFDRLGKKLILTPIGLGLLDHARAMAAAAEAMALTAASRSQDVAGRVSISATEALSVFVLPDIVARIRREAPQITIAVVATDAISDLRRREADIAIRHVRPSEPELIGKSMGDMEACLYAADDWIAVHGLPRSAADLAEADILAFEPVDRFIDYLARIDIALSADQCRIVSANAVALWEMLRKGLGVGVMLRLAAERQAGLTRVLAGQPPIPVPVWLVTHSELRTSRRVRIVFDIVADELRRLVRSPPH